MDNARELKPTVTEPPGRRSTELAVTGMNCTNCVRHVTEALQDVTGVASVTVRLEDGQATVQWQPALEPEVDRLLAAVEKAGYNAKVIEPGEAGAGAGAYSPLAAWRFNVIFGAVLTLPLILGEWVFGLGETTWFHWFSFATAAPVMFVCGRGFFRGAWQQLKRGSSNMDTLVTLGSSTAFGYSVWGLLSGWSGHLYFMEAAAIVTLISTGHWLEAIASSRATDSLRALMDLTPPTARRLEPGGGEREVPVDSIVPGDLVVLKPGDRVPTDGAVTEGGSAVDESMLTGESQPVEKAAGDTLYAGTVNLDGRLLMRVENTGEGTALARIIVVVQRAQASRANIQRLVDRVSNVFVPTVVLIALATALWWGLAYSQALQISQSIAPYLWHIQLPATALAAAFIHAAAVLIVACPCAMGLATPAAIMAGTNAAARRGILIRDGQALEKSGRITAVVFDKTGTITQGQLAVAAIHDLAAQDPAAPQSETLAAAMARLSQHPLSRAIAGLEAAPPTTQDPADACCSTPPNTNGSTANSFSDWREFRGRGVEARLTHGTTARLGSLKWLAGSGVAILDAGGFVQEWSDRGATVVGLAQDQRLLALFALQDRLKSHAAAVVQQLTENGMRVYLITGDQRATAMAIANQAGIARANVFAEILAEQKAEVVGRLQQQGERIAFVGDGINDAPALEQAELGIAVTRASDVAREAADILLLNSDIQAIPEALGLAQATLRTIKQNLFWAFFYNAAAVPLAALGFLSPVMCALAMGLSDLLVIGNALRLRGYRGRGPSRPEAKSSQVGKRTA
jgi:P-type Cu+ transporter